MAKVLIIFIICLTNVSVLAQTAESPKDEKGFRFSGRISRLNSVGRLARIRTDFANIKFLNRRDRLEFWNESHPEARCIGLVEGRTNDYLLMKVPEYDNCVRRVHFTTGSFLNFESPDLEKTVVLARELVSILLKKRLAMQAKKERHARDLESYVEKSGAVNQRYEILRQKLEIEWQKELAAVAEDKARSFTEFKAAEARLNEIDTKLEAYRIEDHNLKLDRWSLDPALYIKK
ncbi:MAG TPA: hypothetical protein VNJ08_02490 [Bacteriovoracaceae bacterium]|nr:hypothetical protein [Bacteriovoracaceae bacterium]